MFPDEFVDDVTPYVARSYEAELRADGYPGLALRFATVVAGRTRSPREVEHTTAEVADVVLGPPPDPRFPNLGSAEPRSLDPLLDALFAIVHDGIAGRVEYADQKAALFAHHAYEARACVIEEPLAVSTTARSLRDLNRRAAERNIRAAGVIGNAPAGERFRNIVVFTLHSGAILCGRPETLAGWLGRYRPFVGWVMNGGGRYTREQIRKFAEVPPKAGRPSEPST